MKLEETIDLIKDYDNLIQIMPFIKTETMNSLLNVFPNKIKNLIKSELPDSANVYLMFNQLNTPIQIDTATLRFVEIVDFSEMVKEPYIISKIIKPTWILAFKNKPSRDIINLFIANDFHIDTTRGVWSLVRPGKISVI